ncbi:hypothetical protein B5K11_19985 [Rhizobium leguminosarum bv. trifolii]|uniref:hypothetical protein n=1 Tax=Rhizobium leguminosarum TaxID=384 RepID=UPI000E2F7438|nr:hypothetical protein [Rhizobium leguminosarum]RFB90336.1 hypothetical protein B5K11_19985 [Rhizobium leguminosarum bv. trifolii]
MVRSQLVAIAFTMAIASFAHAEEAEVPGKLPSPTVIKLNPADGCYRYSGDAVEFVGRFKVGSYIGVTMNTLDANGLPSPADREERIPAMDAPEFQTAAPGSWFGPLPQSKDYVITFMPRAAFGSLALVTICGRAAVPQ